MRAPIAPLAAALLGCVQPLPSPPEADLDTDPPAPFAPVTVASYNALCSFCDSDYAPWAERLDAFAALLADAPPDLIGVQELALPSEVADWAALLPHHEVLVWDGEGPWPDPALLWDARRFSRLDHGFVWLSDTPDAPYSSSFDPPQLPRLFAWVRLRDLPSGQELAFVSTHFDNNTPSQTWSAPLARAVVDDLDDDGPVFLTGDFNSAPDTLAYALLTGASADFPFEADAPEGWTSALSTPGWTDVAALTEPAVRVEGDATGLSRLFTVEGRIDHLFVAGPGTFRAADHRLVVGPREAGALPPSDHPYVTATLNWAP